MRENWFLEDDEISSLREAMKAIKNFHRFCIEEQEKTIEKQNELISRMRDVLRYCARNDVGTYYQQQSAREMVLNNKKIIWDRMNPDGYTYNEKYRQWIYECAEGREVGSGAKALAENDEYERILRDGH